MKTLNYIDPIFSPSILLDSPNHHYSFKKAGNSVKQRSSPPNNLSEIDGMSIIIKYANGAKITDTKGNEYIDFHLSQRTNILGHTPVKILESIEESLKDGINHGMPTLAENILDKAIQEAIPSIEKVKLVNSGAEAVKGAIRLAKAFTGKTRIIVFEGTTANGIDNFQLENDAKLIISLPFNNEALVSEAFLKYTDDIAAIIIEPVPSNYGVVLPKQGYLQFLRKITSESQSLLIFDETTTGFRPNLSGAQGYFGVTPDLTILGKIIGGGLPISAIGGRKEIVSKLALQNIDSPINSITAIAGIATLKCLSTPLFYETLNYKSRDFIYWLTEITKHKGIVINSFRSMFSLYFSEKEVTNYSDVKNSDIQRLKQFNKKLLEAGIYLSTAPFEANFISITHLPEDLNRTLEVVYTVLKTV